MRIIGGNFGEGTRCAGCGETLMPLVDSDPLFVAFNLQVMTWATGSGTVGIGQYWIGLTKVGEKWKWDHDSGKVFQTTSDLGRWRSGQPHSSHECAMVGGDGQVISQDCDAEKPLLCVKRKYFHHICMDSGSVIRYMQNQKTKLL